MIHLGAVPFVGTPPRRPHGRVKLEHVIHDRLEILELVEIFRVYAAHPLPVGGSFLRTCKLSAGRGRSFRGFLPFSLRPDTAAGPCQWWTKD